MKKYLVRSHDFCIFETDETNGCYRLYETTDLKNRPNAWDYFTFETLTEVYGFFPITEKEISEFEDKNRLHMNFMSWQSRSDGHDGRKGGTLEEYLQYLDRVKRFEESEIEQLNEEK